MSEKFKISKENLGKLFAAMKKAEKIIFAPVKKDDKVIFDYVSNADEFAEDYIQTVQSAKSVAFPRWETIIKYKRDKEGYKLEDIDFSKSPEVVLFGVHPCDAASFNVLNSVFTWDYNDKFFTERYRKLTIIGLSCSDYDDFCFCTSVGLSPNSTKGSDMLLTKLKSGDYLAEIITEKGKAIYDLSQELFEITNNEQRTTNNELIAEVPVKFDSKKLTDNLANAFESLIWLEHSLRCLGCGACAFVCPTCSCFDIQDEGKETEGRRVKCWDSCGFSNFTAHASGHNPRENQVARWRQRVLHKFSYQPDRLNITGCVGCGRCSRACPVDMNLAEHLTSITNYKLEITSTK